MRSYEKKYIITRRLKYFSIYDTDMTTNVHDQTIFFLILCISLVHIVLINLDISKKYFYNNDDDVTWVLRDRRIEKAFLLQPLLILFVVKWVSYFFNHKKRIKYPKMILMKNLCIVHVCGSPSHLTKILLSHSHFPPYISNLIITKIKWSTFWMRTKYEMSRESGTKEARSDDDMTISLCLFFYRSPRLLITSNWNRNEESSHDFTACYPHVKLRKPQLRGHS